MRLPSFPGSFAYVILFVVVLTVRSCSAASSTEANSTRLGVEDEEDESLEEMTLSEFKERYRRLIPYMTFYVANNYVNAQSSLAPGNPKDTPANSPLIRENPQSFLTRFSNIPRRTGNYRINTQTQEKKFVPSLQYDPGNVGGDNDYFTPMRYNTKANYDDYSSGYQLYQSQKATYPEIMTPSGQIATHKENRYFANVRPLRPYTTNVRDHLPRKQLVKPVHVSPPEDYVLDYNAKPVGGNAAINYAIKDYQGLRYVPHASVQQASSIPQVHRNPSIDLGRIIESFQLSERLPEMLNKDNLDNSLKMLVEILNILHNSKKEQFPQLQSPQLKPLKPSIPLTRYSHKILKYDNQKSRQQTRPKVITETSFQATPNPLFLTDDPDRFKAMTYVDETKPKLALQPNYNNVNGLNNNKILEYYTPYVQDVAEEEENVAYKPTVKPQTDSSSTQHSYEITEDLQDDIVQDERYTLPVTTEGKVQGYIQQNEISAPEPNVPKSSIKYGATRGKPSVDYPAYATIPQTDFSCKEQRYKGFFGDPATGCQVWHYCDLNGGKSSFLCPNGTIFSQVALTCDWWFNVKCETTTQLYVLNERLYKYILPIMPKFPEDFTGPEVDRYLEIKFKEMEAKLKEKKLKKQQEEREKHKNKIQAVEDDE